MWDEKRMYGDDKEFVWCTLASRNKYWDRHEDIQDYFHAELGEITSSLLEWFLTEG